MAKEVEWSISIISVDEETKVMCPYNLTSFDISGRIKWEISSDQYSEILYTMLKTEGEKIQKFII